MKRPDNRFRRDLRFRTAEKADYERYQRIFADAGEDIGDCLEACLDYIDKSASGPVEEEK